MAFNKFYTNFIVLDLGLHKLFFLTGYALIPIACIVGKVRRLRQRVLHQEKPLPSWAPRVIGSIARKRIDPLLPERGRGTELPPAPWRAAASRRRPSSPSSSSSAPYSPSPSSSPSSFSVPRRSPSHLCLCWLVARVPPTLIRSSAQAGTWRGGRCWFTCRWCRRSPACARRRPLNPSRLIAAASPGSTSPRLRPPKGESFYPPHDHTSVLLLLIRMCSC